MQEPLFEQHAIQDKISFPTATSSHYAHPKHALHALTVVATAKYKLESYSVLFSPFFLSEVKTLKDSGAWSYKTQLFEEGGSLETRLGILASSAI